MAKQQQTQASSNERNHSSTAPGVSSRIAGETTGLTRLCFGLQLTGNHIDDQVAQLANPRLQTVQCQAIATQIGRIQGNHHMQKVAATIAQRSCSPGHEGPPRSIARYRFARSGEPYHATVAGWQDPPAGQESERRPTAASLEASIASNDFFETQINNLMESEPIMRMRQQQSSLLIVFHLTRRIFNVINRDTGAVQERSNTLGQTLHGPNSISPANEVHIAIKDSLSLSELDETAAHELMHAFMAAPAPPSTETRGRRRRRTEDREASLHPRELENALCYPQYGLATRIAWPSNWNHEYRFGWFLHPESQTWRHLDNPILWQGGPEDLTRCAAQSAERASRPGSDRDYYQRLQSKYNQLIRIKRERRYESGFRVEETPEEDAATTFGRYFSRIRELAFEHPKRYSLMHIFFNRR